MNKRIQLKRELSEFIKDLREYSIELELLYLDMDKLTIEEFDKRSDEIQDKFSKSILC